jgi:hypothetical protein
LDAQSRLKTLNEQKKVAFGFEFLECIHSVLPILSLPCPLRLPDRETPMMTTLRRFGAVYEVYDAERAPLKQASDAIERSLKKKKIPLEVADYSDRLQLKTGEPPQPVCIRRFFTENDANGQTVNNFKATCTLKDLSSRLESMVAEYQKSPLPELPKAGISIALGLAQVVLSYVINLHQAMTGEPDPASILRIPASITQKNGFDPVSARIK